MHNTVKRLRAVVAALSKTERSVFFGAAAVAGVTLISSIGFAIEAATVVVPARGGNFAEGIVGQPKFVNPVLAQSEVDKGLVRLIFENVTDLAEAIEPSKDSRIWRVRVKEEIQWHDGTPLTADDIVFTVEKIQDPESDSPLFGSWQGVLAERRSEREVQFNLGVPYAFFDISLKNLYVLPKHIFGNVPPANWKISDFRLKPIGSGPYAFESYEAETNGFITTYRLVSYDGYFGDAPFIPNVDMKFFSAKDKLTAAFNQGLVDGVPGLERSDLVLLQRPYESFEAALPGYYAVFLNQSQNIALKELAVRRALDFAINKKELVRAAFGTDSPAATGLLEKNSALIPRDDLAPTQEKARTLLDEAEWKLNDDGFREKRIKNADVPLELTLTVPDIPFLVRTAEAAKAAWEAIGAKTTVTVVPSEIVRTRAIKNRDYQAILYGHILNQSDDLFSFWHSSERFYPGANLSLYNSKKADELIEGIRHDPNPESRNEKFAELIEEIRGDSPAIFLYAPNYLYVATKDLKGFKADLLIDPADRFAGLPKWHVKTARILR